jgi:hypothetical protein
MNMVEAIVMGAAIRPRPPDVKAYRSFRGDAQHRTRNLEIPRVQLHP